MEDSRLLQCAVKYSKRFEWWDVWMELHHNHGMDALAIVEYLKADDNLEMISRRACEIVAIQNAYN